jgi:nicotinamidase-related amidase
MLEGQGAVPAAAAVRPVLHELLERARRADVPVVHVQNDGGPDDPDQPFTSGWELVFAPQPAEEIVRKDVCDTFTADTGLAGRLRARGVDTVVVAGMQSEYCIKETALGAVREGFSVVLPRQAHATYDGAERAATAVSDEVEQHVQAAGVTVSSASEIVFEQ